MKTSSIKSLAKKLGLSLFISTALIVTLDRVVLSLDSILDPESLKGAKRDSAGFRFCQAGMFESLDAPPRHFGLTPSIDITVDGCRYAHNSMGLRGDEVTTPKPPGTLRTLVIGDSYTYGWGVDQDETIPAQVASLMGEASPETRLEVLNCGVPAYDSASEFGFLRDVGLSLEPDLVLLVFQVNDVTEVDQFYLDDYKGFYACALPLGYRVKRWLDHSPLYHLARKAHTNYKTKSGFEWFAEAEWPTTRSYLEQFVALCAEREIPLLIVNLPHFQIAGSPMFLVKYQETDPGFCRQNRWVNALAAELATPCVDLLPAFQHHVEVERRPVEKLYVVPADPGNPDAPPQDHHLNKDGCRLVAEKTVEALRQHGLWPPGS